jgi:uncharacterized protein (DUF58 family)
MKQAQGKLLALLIAIALTTALGAAIGSYLSFPFLGVGLGAAVGVWVGAWITHESVKVRETTQQDLEGLNAYTEGKMHRYKLLFAVMEQL